MNTHLNIYFYRNFTAVSTPVVIAYGVVVTMFDFHRSDRVRIPVVAVKFHNVYDYIIERHPWQVSKIISHGFTQAM